jgi:uncharacterized membrane protein YbhN (UPF0104 family)
MSRRLRLTQIAVSAVALGLVVWWALRQQAPRLPDTPGAIAWIAAAIVVYFAGTAVRAERWRLILHRTSVAASRPDAYGLTTVGYMGNNLLPARAGEVIRVMLMSRQTGHGVRKVGGSVIAERMLDVVVLGLALLVVARAVLPARALPGDAPALFAAGGVAVLVTVALALRFVGHHALVARARAFAEPLADAPRALLHPRGLAFMALTAVVWLFEAVVYVMVGRAVGLHLGAVDAGYLVALTNFSTALPAAPGSLGTFEAAVVFGLTAISLAGQAVSYMLMLRFVLYVPITIVGLGVLFARYRGVRLLRERPVAAAAGEGSPPPQVWAPARRSLGVPVIPTQSEVPDVRR